VNNIIKQDSDYDCMLACLANYVGQPIAKVFDKELIDSINDAKTCTDDNIDKSFNAVGLKRGSENGDGFFSMYVSATDARSRVIKSLLRDRKAIIQVPSLNYEDGSHMVYWDGKELIDPSTKQVYYWLSQINMEYIFLLP